MSQDLSQSGMVYNSLDLVTPVPFRSLASYVHPAASRAAARRSDLRFSFRFVTLVSPVEILPLVQNRVRVSGGNRQRERERERAKVVKSAPRS